MKYFLIAGESSGDNLGASLITEIIKNDQAAIFEFWGGDLMEKSSGIKPKKHFKELAFMGIWEVVKHLPKILMNFSIVKKQILAFNPDAVIFIDFPGFNLRLTKWVKSKNIKTIFYVSPTVWAWNRNRVFTIEKFVDLMICILPFEINFYKDYKVKAIYEGNPVVDGVHAFTKDTKFLSLHNIQKPVLAIIPGSRKQEISSILDVMLQGAKKFEHKYDIVISKVAHLSSDLYQEVILSNNIKCQIIENKYKDILAHANIALVTSGTASLETAIFGVPQVVCYKTSNLTYQIGKRVIKTKYLSLPNLIVDRPLLKELIQEECTEKNISEAIVQIQHKDVSMYSELYSKLGSPDSASRIAKSIIQFLKPSKATNQF
jgi:lipid-A-disaccharide synthase